MSAVITRAAAQRQGISLARQRHLLARGTWQRLHDGVYVRHTGPVSYRERLEAAVLARGPGACVSLECALTLWGLSDRQPPIITLAEPATTHRTRALPGVRVRRRRRLAVAVRHGIPVTSGAQSVLDVAALTDARDELVALVTRALARRVVGVAELRAELAHHPRHRHRAFLGELLTVAAEGLESAAEVRYAVDVERAHGLPRSRRQVADGPTAVRDGRSRRVDVRYDEQRVVVEVDGELWHRERAHEDRARDRQAAARGEVVLRAGWADVAGAPCALAAEVAAVLLTRGWGGMARPCGAGCPVGRCAAA